MLFWKSASRARRLRDRAKAQALIDEYGEAARDVVAAQLADSAWQIRERRYWVRIAAEVKSLLR